MPAPITTDNTFINAVTSIGVDIYPHDPNPSTSGVPISNVNTGSSITNITGAEAGVGATGPNTSQSTTPMYTFSVNSTSSAFGGILSASIGKNIRSTTPGTFQLELTPGGPATLGGVNSVLSWTSIITPMSLAVIYLSRGSSKRIVMVGVVTGIDESQTWSPRGVQRVIRITGNDFHYYFSSFSYYTMAFLGAFSTSATTSIGNLGYAGFLFNDFGGYFLAAPAVEGALWFERVMVGNGNTTTPAILENTYVTYQGTSIPLKTWYTYSFEAFIEVGQQMVDGGIFDISNSESDWMTKFNTLFPMPFYEFFVTTATEADFTQETAPLSSVPVGSVALASDGVGRSGTQISVAGYDPVTPLVISRVLPFPWIQLNGNAVNPTLPGSATGVYNSTRWDALPIYSYTQGYLSSTVEYSLSEVRNFFGVITSDIRQISEGAHASPLMTSLETIGTYLDRWSVDSYGYRPQIIPLRWMTAPAVKGPPINVAFYRQILLGKLASYYVPTPNMLRGEVTIPLWPSVVPGAKFEYVPFRNTTKYTFYIEGVTHNYRFGGPSTTTLSLSRGLPSAVYSNPSQMQDLLLDNVARVNGNFIERTNSTAVPGLVYINTAERDNITASTTPPTLGGPSAITSSYGPSTPSVPHTATLTPPDYLLPGAGVTINTMFQNAVTAAKCPNLDWRLLWAIAQVESSGGLNPAAMNPSTPLTSFGVMQISCGHSGISGPTSVCTLGPPNFNTADPITQAINNETPTTLVNNYQNNINYGAQIFCQDLALSGNDIRTALGKYNHDTTGAYANAVAIQYAKLNGYF